MTKSHALLNSPVQFWVWTLNWVAQKKVDQYPTVAWLCRLHPQPVEWLGVSILGFGVFRYRNLVKGQDFAVGQAIMIVG